MASYSPAPSNDPATQETVGRAPTKPGGADWSGVLEKLGKKYLVVLVLTTLMVVLALIVVVLAALIGTATTTQQPATTPPPPPLLSSIVGIDTDGLPPAIKEQVLRQLQAKRELPECRLVDTSIKVADVLREDPWNVRLEGTPLIHNIAVARCQGLCEGPGSCQPKDTVFEDFVILYNDSRGTVQYAKRQVQHHRLCQCQVG